MAPRQGWRSRGRSGGRGADGAVGRFGRRAGFTLIELMVAIVLLAGVVGMAVPYVNSMFGVTVRESSRKLSGTLRYFFDRAAITGKTYRVAINLDRHAWWVEVNDSEKEALVYRDEREREDGEKRQADLLEEMDRQRKLAIGAASTLTVPLADQVLATFSRVDDAEAKPVILPDSVAVLGVWTPQYSEVQRPAEEPPKDEAKDQVVYVHLFPGGYAERAFIYIGDGDEDVYTLEMEPLTGRVLIHNEEIEVPREYLRR